MAGQDEVLSNMPKAVAGMIADDGMGKDVLSTFSEESSAEIPFGVMVGQGTADDGCLKLAAITDQLRGVTTFGHSHDKPGDLGSTGFKPAAHFGVLTKGRIYVFPETSVTPASEVHVRAVAGGSEVAGAFRGTADGTDTINLSGVARWRTSGSSTVPAVLEIDLLAVKPSFADS